jgi:hypothetical protein
MINNLDELVNELATKYADYRKRWIERTKPKLKGVEYQIYIMDSERWNLEYL